MFDPFRDDNDDDLFDFIDVPLVAIVAAMVFVFLTYGFAIYGVWIATSGGCAP